MCRKLITLGTTCDVFSSSSRSGFLCPISHVPRTCILFISINTRFSMRKLTSQPLELVFYSTSDAHHPSSNKLVYYCTPDAHHQALTNLYFIPLRMLIVQALTYKSSLTLSLNVKTPTLSRFSSHKL